MTSLFYTLPTMGFVSAGWPLFRAIFWPYYVARAEAILADDILSELVRARAALKGSHR